MTRRPKTVENYLENMENPERKQNERHWKQQLLSAVEKQDSSTMEKLILEGLNKDYTFPDVDNPLYWLLLAESRSKSK